MFTEMKTIEATELAKMLNVMYACESTKNLSILSDGNGQFKVSFGVTVVNNGTVASVQLREMGRADDWSLSIFDAVKKAYREVYLKVNPPNCQIRLVHSCSHVKDLVNA